MTKLFPIVIAFVTLAATVIAAPYPPIWPIPRKFASGKDVLVVNPTLKQTMTCQQSSLLDAAFGRMTARLFMHKVNSSGSNNNNNVADTVSTCVKNSDTPLTKGVDESYSLNVDTKITIECNTPFGCMHAYETLSQLIGFDYSIEQYNVLLAPWAIQDAPRFEHRGLLIDTSRHYLPLQQLYNIIDSLTYNKLNVMHWHIVDAIAFPYVSTAHPQLGTMGSYSEKERYTPSDVSAVIQYANARGVRVMMELDTPGHSGAMCYGMPEVCPDPLCTSNNINNWVLDPTKDVTYKVIGDLIQELTTLDPAEQLFHIGGDEVVTYCWSQHPYIMKWLSDHNLTLDGGVLYYVKKVIDMVQAGKKTVVGWQELWDNFGTQLPKGTVIQQWLPNSVVLPLNVTSQGYELIWSDSSVWYLDHLAVSWQQMYAAEPCTGLPAKNCELILGGEGCMWGETVDTSDWGQTVYPRLSAIAERLWSAPETKIDANTLPRLQSFRCLLEERGVPAAPVLNNGARQAPPGPGSCFRQ